MRGVAVHGRAEFLADGPERRALAGALRREVPPVSRAAMGRPGHARRPRDVPDRPDARAELGARLSAGEAESERTLRREASGSPDGVSGRVASASQAAVSRSTFGRDRLADARVVRVEPGELGGREERRLDEGAVDRRQRQGLEAVEGGLAAGRGRRPAPRRPGSRSGSRTRRSCSSRARSTRSSRAGAPRCCRPWRSDAGPRGPRGSCRPRGRCRGRSRARRPRAARARGRRAGSRSSPSGSAPWRARCGRGGHA